MTGRHAARNITPGAGKVWDDEHGAWALSARHYPPAVALATAWAEARQATRRAVEDDEAGRILAGWSWTR